MIRTLLVALALLAPQALSGADVRAPDFDRDIAPLLARRCLDCHSGPAAKGELDLSRRKTALAVIEAGKPEDSTLWQRLRDDEMPPKKPLSASEKALVKRWIAAGARWGTDPVDPFRVSTDHRAGYDWWSLQPVRSPTPPAPRDASWARHPIDRFVLDRLRQKGLTPSPQADRRTLVRRLSFDLTGLPPTPEEVAAFVADTRPDAYERLVDRLLGSPGYGERWARHWLDVVRFGESDGFERDLPRLRAWPYRDWVVRAFNSDLPYDEFVRLQLAGDALRPEDSDGLAATGFLVAGPHDIVVPVSESMRATMRQDELEDVVGTVGQTFLGLTVHCARCHDHKFDPVSQKDYFRLVASLSGVRHGERTAASEAVQIRLDQLKKQADSLRRDVAAIEEPIRRLLLGEKRKDRPAGPPALASWDFTLGLDDRLGNLHGKLHGKARLTSEGLVLDGRSGHVVTTPLRKPLREKTLEAWVKLADLGQRGGGVVTVQTLDGQVFDSLVFAEQQPGRWLAGSNFFERTRSFDGPEEKEAARQTVHLAVTYHTDGTIAAYRQGVPHGQAYRAKGPITFRPDHAQVVFGLRHGPAGGNRMLAGTIVRARLYDRALSAEEVARSAGLPTIQPEEIPPRLDAGQREKHRRLLEAVRVRMQEIDHLQRAVSRRIYAVNSQPLQPTHLLIRGSVTARGERVEPGVLAALATRVKPGRSASDAGEAARRVELARWITDPNNPLFARVMVNRLWQYHFGTGIVDTPSDLGFNGGRPSHPELLDWLAAELLRQNGSLKALHRLIVTSATYRQASVPRPEAMRIDAENRLLWRRSPQRLEAESVRDAMLVASGQLERTMGGAPYLDFRSYFFKGTQFYDPLEQVGPEFHRRSLYRMWARGGRSPFLDALDCPDPSATTPRRAVTTTPLQALALFNNGFVLHQAERFADRLRGAAGTDVARQVRQAYRHAHGREPEGRELGLLRAFVERHGLEALCRVIFNTNEFVQID